jgi:hypothetical protein
MAAVVLVGCKGVNTADVPFRRRGKWRCVSRDRVFPCVAEECRALVQKRVRLRQRGKQRARARQYWDRQTADADA